MNWGIAGAALALFFSTVLDAVPALAQQAPQRGGTLVVAVPSDPGHLNPAISTGSHVHVVADSLFNGLVGLDRELRPRPDLAERWTVGGGGTVYTFHLAPHARWHDGRPVTSADVKYTFEEILLKHHARTRAGIGANLARIETPDVHTVAFHLRRPYGALLQMLNVTEAPILPRHVYENTDPLKNAANTHPIGSGPFRFESYATDQHTVLTRNPNYFKAGLPYLDRVVFRVIPDANQQVLALIAGEADYVSSVAGANVERLRGRGDLVIDQTRFGTGGGNCIMTVSFNLERKATADLRVRRAIAHAIDRELIVRQVNYGLGRVASAPISSGLTWAHASGALARYDLNAQKAVELLEQAGYTAGSDGVRLTLDLLHFPTFSRYGEVLRQNLSKIGVRIVQRPLDRAAFVDSVFAKRDFDLNLISYCNGADPDSGVRRMYVSSNIGNIPFSNAAAYRNPEVDRLFAAAAEAADYAESARLYREVQAILARDLPYWSLVETVVTSVWRAPFAGFAPWSGHFAERAWLRR